MEMCFLNCVMNEVLWKHWEIDWNRAANGQHLGSPSMGVGMLAMSSMTGALCHTHAEVRFGQIIINLVDHVRLSGKGGHFNIRLEYV